MCFNEDNLDNELNDIELYFNHTVLAEAEEDVRARRIATMQNTFDNIRASLIDRKTFESNSDL